MNIMGRGNDGALDRVLDAPTNEAWIDPWVKLLREARRALPRRPAVEALDVRGGRDRAARARATATAAAGTIEADWFVSRDARRARAASCGRRRCSRATRALEGMNELYVDWMNGIQFYLRKPLDITRGHMTFIDAPWALTALTQASSGPSATSRATTATARSVDCLSVDISDWDTPGIVYGKPAKQCTREEVAKEVLDADQGAPQRQRRRHPHRRHDPLVAPRPGDPVASARGAQLERRAAAGQHGRLVGEAARRRTRRSRTCSCAGDYVQTDIDLATMEGANESGRAAVNALLEASGSKAEPRADVQALRPAGVRGREGGRPRALQAGPAERARPQA